MQRTKPTVATFEIIYMYSLFCFICLSFEVLEYAPDLKILSPFSVPGLDISESLVLPALFWVFSYTSVSCKNMENVGFS